MADKLDWKPKARDQKIPRWVKTKDGHKVLVSGESYDESCVGSGRQWSWKTRGRPRKDALANQALFLHDTMGLSWTKVGRKMGMSSDAVRKLAKRKPGQK